MRIRRLLKFGLISLVGLVVILALAFATFVYNPFEGRITVLRKAVPRNIDFYVGKRNLREDFETFPEPVFWYDLKLSSGFAAIRKTRLVRQQAERQIERVLTQVREFQARLAEVPLVTLGILSDMIGQDLVLAGRFSKSAPAKWCAYSRVSWKIRAAIQLLRYEAVRSRLSGMRVKREGGLLRLEVPGSGTLFMCRVLDVVLIGNSPELVAESRDLASGESGADSLAASSDYQDRILKPLENWREGMGDPGNALEFSLNIESLRRLHSKLESWPGNFDDISIEGRLFKSFVKMSALRRLWGSMIFHEQSDEIEYGGKTLSALLHVVMNRTELSGFQTRFLGERHGNTGRWLSPLLINVPDTAAAVAVIRVPASAFMHELVQSLDRDMRDLIDEGLRGVGQARGLAGLVETIAPAFEPFVAIVVRINKFRVFSVRIEVKEPSPIPAYAIICRVVPSQLKRIEDLVKLMDESYRNFRFEKRFNIPLEPEKSDGKSTLKIVELQHPFIPGTGEAAYLDGSRALDRYFMFGNHGKLLLEIYNARLGRHGVKSLSDDPTMKDVLSRMPQNLSGFCYFEGQKIREIVSGYRSFEKARFDGGDPSQGWKIQTRAVVEEEIFKRDYRGQYRDKRQLGKRELQKFEEKINAELDRRWAAVRGTYEEDSLRWFADLYSQLMLLDKVFVAMRTGNKDLSFEVRTFLGF
ncbi:MAG: hypothetical protein ACE5F1_08210 [Planctomycetota bacterium]